MCVRKFLIVMVALTSGMIGTAASAGELADRLTRISQALRGGIIPSAELILQADNDPKSVDVEKIVDGWLQSDEFMAHMRSWYDQQFRAPYLLDSPIEFLDNAPDGLRESLANESVEFALWVLSNNLPYTTLLESRFAVRNSMLERFYSGLDPTGADTTDWHPVWRENFDAGMLTLKSMHFRNPTTIVNRWRTHANQVLKTWSCQELEAAVDVEAKEDDETHGTDPACAGCHRPLDGIGTFFARWDRGGNFDPDPDIDDRGSYYETTSRTHQANGLNGLGKLISSSRRFAQCMVDKSWKFFAGRDMTKEEVVTRTDLLQSFWQSNYNMRTLIKAIVLSQEFATNS